jgi:hypothetical protein
VSLLHSASVSRARNGRTPSVSARRAAHARFRQAKRQRGASRTRRLDIVPSRRIRRPGGDVRFAQGASDRGAVAYPPAVGCACSMRLGILPASLTGDARSGDPRDRRRARPHAGPGSSALSARPARRRGHSEDGDARAAGRELPHLRLRADRRGPRGSARCRRISATSNRPDRADWNDYDSPTRRLRNAQHPLASGARRPQQIFSRFAPRPCPIGASPFAPVTHRSSTGASARW